MYKALLQLDWVNSVQAMRLVLKTAAFFDRGETGSFEVLSRNYIKNEDITLHLSTQELVQNL